MRGGTSKAIFFLKNDLPADEDLRDRVIRRVFGAPDVREIDGLGGADPLTSKVAIIGPSTRPDCDVDYLFGQVNINEPMIDYVGNCGNISAAVGPFAIDQGLVQAQAPLSVVRIHQVNTRSVIVAEVPVQDNRAAVEGDHAIAGVPGTGAKILLDFSDSAGSITGRLLPTGEVTDTLVVEGEGEFQVSLVDVGNPLVFVRAADLGMTGTETPPEIDGDSALMDRIEKLRSVAAQRMGLVQDWRRATVERPYVPFVACCAPPRSYTSWATGEAIDASATDLTVRLLFMQQTHKTYPVSGTVCTAAATMIPGTIASELARPGTAERGEVRIGHPSGVIVPEGRVAMRQGEYVLERATVDRTARCLMTGYAYIPKSTLG